MKLLHIQLANSNRMKVPELKQNGKPNPSFKFWEKISMTAHAVHRDIHSPCKRCGKYISDSPSRKSIHSC